jgi:hypothetical protein
MQESFLHSGDALRAPGEAGRRWELRGGVSGGAGALALTTQLLEDRGAGWRSGVGAEAIRFDGGERLAAVELISGYRLGAAPPLEILPMLGIGYTSLHHVVLAYGVEADVTWSLGRFVIGPTLSYSGALGRQEAPAAWLGGVMAGGRW